MPDRISGHGQVILNLKSSRKTNIRSASGKLCLFSENKSYILFQQVHTFPYSNHSTAAQKKNCSLILHFINRGKILFCLKHHLSANRMINLTLYQTISEYLDKIKGFYFAKLMTCYFLIFSLYLSQEIFITHSHTCISALLSSNPQNAFTSCSIWIEQSYL